jgi:PAS domain-containing protein
LSNNFPTIDGVRAEEQRTADGGIIGVCIDVTELKHREASFRLLFEHNPIPMWVLEQDSMRFLAVNDAAVEHYGFSRDAIPRNGRV